MDLLDVIKKYRYLVGIIVSLLFIIAGLLIGFHIVKNKQENKELAYNINEGRNIYEKSIVNNNYYGSFSWRSIYD